MRESKKEILSILLQMIPLGNVTTYKSLAKILRTSPRALGRMLKQNSQSIVTPCHRVVRSSGDVGGYSLSGRERREFKLKLLKLEGVNVSGDRVSPESMISLDEMLLGESE